MGNCFTKQEDEDNSPRRAQRRRSSFGSLNDSRHVMMRRSSAKGTEIQKDGTFYKPRDDSLIDAIEKLKDLDLSDDDVSEKNEAGTEESEEKPEGNPPVEKVDTTC